MEHEIAAISLHRLSYLFVARGVMLDLMDAFAVEAHKYGARLCLLVINFIQFIIDN